MNCVDLQGLYLIRMKLILFFLTSMVLSITLAQQNPEQKIEWEFFHPIKKIWIKAGTHGSVQEKLIETGELPDPFFGLNESSFSWVEEHNWVFKAQLLLTEEQLSKEFVELYFPGVDTYAEVFINETKIGFCENAFRPYSFDIKSFAKLGMNELKLVFISPVNFHAENYKNATYKLPAPNDVHPIAIAPYTRKPQYQFGWDWALRMNTIGLLKPLELYSYNDFRIIGKNIQTLSIDKDIAKLKVELYLSHPAKSANKTVVSENLLFDPIPITVGQRFVSKELEVNHPKLWWPRGQGEAYLYADNWMVKSGSELVSQTGVFKYGIRVSDLRMDADQWGTMHEVSINNRPIFCKGGDYIPQDIFPARVKDEDLRRMVENMAAANFNMVRVWGGGYYPDEAFFQACDEMGIMVWQDFMFACAMYPGDEAFLKNVEQEFRYQIPRIASHPSVVLFNGNNEVDVAWKNWGFQVKYLLYGESAKTIEESYVKLFKKLLPSVLKEYTVIPYSHTSPLSNWGKDEFYNHGSQHYWGVWHGKDPMGDFGKKIGRFNAEYGFQSFPEYATIGKFAPRDQWDLDAAVMKSHQKSYVGNGMILKHARLLFGEPSSFEDFVYYSQLTQATAVSMAVNGHRLDFPRCMGTLYWQVNDCWPAPTWSSMDYYWNWKALHYWVKEDYKDLTVLSRKTKEGISEYYLVNDTPDSLEILLTTELFDLSGKKKIGKQKKLFLPPFSKAKMDLSGIMKAENKENCMLIFNWQASGDLIGSRSYSILPESYKSITPDEVELKLQITDPVRHKGVIFIKNSTFLRNCWLFSSRSGLHLKTNFMDLLPGEHQIEFEYDADNLPQLADLNIKFM